MYRNHIGGGKYGKGIELQRSFFKVYSTSTIKLEIESWGCTNWKSNILS